MVLFSIPLHGTQPVLAVVAAHGITDLDSIDWVPPYVICSLVAAPLVTPVFLTASVGHFAEDVGIGVSAVIHAAVGVVCLLFGPELAFTIMLAYIAIVHVPIHYAKCLLRGRVRAVIFGVAATVAAVAFSSSIGPVFCFNDCMQRVATAHIFHEMMLTRKWIDNGRSILHVKTN